MARAVTATDGSRRLKGVTHPRKPLRVAVMKEQPNKVYAGERIRPIAT